MRLLDPNLEHGLARYAFQCLLAALTVLGVLLLLDSAQQTAIIASIGASCFLVFTAPRSFASRTRGILGGYAVGTTVGVGCSLLAGLSGSGSWDAVHIIAGAASVGLAIFVMVATDTEHPPAAGLALAYVLNEWTPLTLAAVMGAAAFLAAVRLLLKGWLRSLI